MNDVATSVWNSLRGHAPQRELFRKTIARGRLSQGYVLVGPPGIGKQRFARLLAQCLFCHRHAQADLEACGQCEGCRPFLAGAHPDFLTVEREAGKRELTIDKFIGSAEQRGRVGLCHDLALRPSVSSRKIALINDADTMNDEAANALLKTLEEPPPGALLLLIAGSADRLLPTIRSRCQTVRFSPLAEADIAALLMEQRITETETQAEAVARLSEGSLETAAQLLDPQLLALRKLMRGTFARGDFSGLQLAKQTTEQVDEIAKGDMDQRTAARWALRFLAESLRDFLQLVANTTASQSAAVAELRSWLGTQQRPPKSWIDLTDKLLGVLIDADSQLYGNVPVPLCLEACFDELARQWRTAKSIGERTA